MGNAEYNPSFKKVQPEEGAVSHQREWRITSCTQPKQNVLYSYKCRDVTARKIQMQPLQWWAESAPPHPWLR